MKKLSSHGQQIVKLEDNLVACKNKKVLIEQVIVFHENNLKYNKLSNNPTVKELAINDGTKIALRKTMSDFEAQLTKIQKIEKEIKKLQQEKIDMENVLKKEASPEEPATPPLIGRIVITSP